MWFYQHQGQSAGPLTEAELDHLIASGSITKETLVWRDGLLDWEPAQATALVHRLAVAMPPPVRPLAEPPPRASPVATPDAGWGGALTGQPHGVASAASGPAPAWAAPAPLGAPSLRVWEESEIGSIRALFTAMWICLVVSPIMIIPIIGWGIGIPALVAAFVLDAVLLYKHWSLIQGHARTTAGKAVGFKFIPLFNLYWVFVAYPGLATDMRAALRHHGAPGASPSTGLAVAFCVLLMTAWVPFIGWFVGVPSLIVVWILMQKQFRDASCLILRSRMAARR